MLPAVDMNTRSDIDENASSNVDNACRLSLVFLLLLLNKLCVIVNFECVLFLPTGFKFFI